MSFLPCRLQTVSSLQSRTLLSKILTSPTFSIFCNKLVILWTEPGVCTQDRCPALGSPFGCLQVELICAPKLDIWYCEKPQCVLSMFLSSSHALCLGRHRLCWVSAWLVTEACRFCHWIFTLEWFGLNLKVHSYIWQTGICASLRYICWLQSELDLVYPWSCTFLAELLLPQRVILHRNKWRIIHDTARQVGESDLICESNRFHWYTCFIQYNKPTPRIIIWKS